MLPADFLQRVPLRKMSTVKGNYAECKSISVGTSVMLFAAGWLLLALVALPLPVVYL
jgi:hypothetical protein